jgi:hypothetical protein
VTRRAIWDALPRIPMSYGAIPAIAGIVLLAWLALSTNPTELRIGRLNALIKSGELGGTNPQLQARLAAQFPWLAKHAGATGRIIVNGPIQPGQLTLLVTRPEHQALTNCGPGNALYDPSLSTIFVDESLLWPTEVNIIGTPSVNSMFSVAEYGYVVSYTNYILAHELGHWQKHSKEAAFFYYGWNDGSANLAEEQEADRAAARTIIAARQAGDEPDILKNLNSLSAIGLDAARLTERESAAGDLFGGILLMTNDLLFSSGPFSPYFADRTHPNLLSRVDDAIRVVENVSPGTSLEAETQLIRSELQRFAALGNWPHREVFLPGPLTVADVRAGALWIGRTDIPSQQTDSLMEQVYRIPLANLEIAGHSAEPLNLSAPVKVGQSKTTEADNFAEGYGTWVTNEFKLGDVTIGLPAPSVSDEPQQDKDWGTSQWGGFEFLGMAWSWPRRGTTLEGRVTERDLVDSLKKATGKSTVTLGRLQWDAGSIVVPVALMSDAGAAAFRLFRIARAEPLLLEEEATLRFTPPAGMIDISAAKNWQGHWWIPVHLNRGSIGEQVELWKVASSQSTRFATIPFLSGQTGPNLSSESLKRLIPKNPRFLPISGGRAVFGYDNDSLYLVDEQRGQIRTLFHPAKSGLQLLDLGGGHLLFWTLHARKAYLVDTNGMRSS